MCALGLYLAFLLLEDMIVGNFSTNSTYDQNLVTKASFNSFPRGMLQRKNITKRSIGKQNKYIVNFTATSGKPNNKQQVEKVTQKQYEIINMLWRKTKTGGDNCPTSKGNNITKTHKWEYNSLTTPSPITTTSSQIEFYYMDDNHPTVDKNNCTSTRCKTSKITEKTTNLPFLIFHLKGPYVDPIPLSTLRRLNRTRLQNDQIRISAIRLKEVQQLSRKPVTAPVLFTKEESNTVHDKTALSLNPIPKNIFFDNNSLIKRAIPQPTLNNINYITIPIRKYTAPITESTTMYDKIKFFEMYDQFTRRPCTKKDTVHLNFTEGNYIDNSEKILLEHVDEGSHDHVQAKLEKKHITESSFKLRFISEMVSKSKVNDKHKQQPNGTSYFMNGNTKSEPNDSNTVFSYLNETVRWSDYPFVAVYIYEPSQVHCDAAAINRHWLIASGSCLTRVSGKENARFGPYGEGQSAFVAYCGELWWEPERIAYVKYTVVHPWYHPRDKTRQHLYNIGAIQVVNSMLSACAGWAPLPLMSYQFAAKSKTTWATAIGWGLDRFDSRYEATDLPKTSLMAYKGVVFFDSCPGNFGYSKAKRLDEGAGVRNVHCLSLPPYYGEDADPVHGALLLADGKLIALYLQEERRPWGEQSAQYTGVWRLIPWLMEIAKEPEEIDTIIFEL